MFGNRHSDGGRNNGWEKLLVIISAVHKSDHCRKMSQKQIILTLLFSCIAVSVFADDWTLYRGDANATGRVSSNAKVTGKLKIVWEHRLEKGFFEAAPIVVGHSIFIGSNQEGMGAFDLLTGKPIWTYQRLAAQSVSQSVTQSATQSVTQSPIDIAASAAYFEGLLFVGDTRGTLHAFQADGTPRWTFNTKGTIDNSPNIDVQKKHVIIGSQKGILYALKADSGEKVWEYETDDQIRCFPSIVGRRCFVAGCDSQLHVVDLDTGKGIRQIPLDAPTGSTPLLVGDFAYVGTEGKEFLAVDWKREKVVWRFPMNQAVRAPAAYREGVIIFGGMDKTVYALDAATGDERWKFNTRGRIEGGAVIVGDRVYVPSMDSSLYVLDFQSGRRIDSIELTGKLSTSPAVVPNRIVIATDEGVLTCLQGE